MTKNPYRVGDRVIGGGIHHYTVKEIGFDGKNLDNRVTFTTGTWANIDWLKLDPAYHSETIEERIENEKSNVSYQITACGYTKTYDDVLAFENDMQVLANFGTQFKAYKLVSSKEVIK